MDHDIEQVVDLTDPSTNRLYNLSPEAARERVLNGTPEAVRAIEGSFALVARSGKTVRLARSLDRPLRYFLAKRAAGPALIVADRIDTIHQWLQREGLAGQFHPSYTRMVPAHHVVFLTTYHVMQRLGLNPARLKAFTLNFGDGPDLEQAQNFLDSLGRGLFLEPIEAELANLDVGETIRIVEDYKPLDIESASMVLTLCRGIRARYPDWRQLIDGDGGDENLKDYPIEENPELTIRSVVHNPMLYQEGWGVGRIKHSLTYSGGLSRSYARTYAPAKHFGFEGFSPFTRPNVIEVAEGIPFAALTGLSVEKLYALKGEIVSRGVKAVTGLNMPVFPKRRFQHGALPRENLRRHLPSTEADCRKTFLSIYL
jgi:asparagine synthase (glutamine-hydrolysing)